MTRVMRTPVITVFQKSWTICNLLNRAEESPVVVNVVATKSKVHIPTDFNAANRGRDKMDGRHC